MDQPPSDRRTRTHPSPHGTAAARRRSWLSGALLTAVLLGLIALSIRSVSGDLAFVLLGSVGLVVGVIHRLFPGSQFFTLALANFIGVYACVFAMFLESSFQDMGMLAQGIGFAMPLAAFVSGAWWRAKDIRSIVQSRRLRESGHFERMFLWMAPVWGIGALTFLLPGRGIPPDQLTLIFLLAMGVISVVVGLVAHDVAVFLLDAGLLFEGFFQQVSRLVLPAFAFLTFYSLVIIVFGTVYTILDRFMVEPNFLVHGQPRDVTLTEGLYFSLVTFATVGYGDISPMTGAVRIVAAVEIVAGVLLLLFGFSAIIGHAKPRDHRDPPDPL
ncbi:two pore domain potassium channel family protein [Azospirillum sp. RWY-5-1]|uniref:Two pore domain potassium channel family protein n=1 Tax=Azospirillum oleiclasticum TaxID=2735135 RepID=A0ABX2TJF3_9PROT|nr:two pore domain potassium channel family protein [Azospirillum oleiclasticum]NYZ16786.1 two pore domain potassium channel family protein [Azospirillum oleiclasticum]NYZ24480.1 two pore domain potassium channel family protein [Azospirillum oleiclasticum]